VQSSNSGYFGAEKIIRNILYTSPSINTVVCTSSNDTQEVVQVLIDLNKIGNITVIGYSNSQQIRNYIKNNIIFGSVYENPQETGYQSIQALAKMLQRKKVPNVINTGVYSITRNNLINYPDGS
jgi:ribose transport system substrate-binding protein